MKDISMMITWIRGTRLAKPDCPNRHWYTSKIFFKATSYLELTIKTNIRRSDLAKTWVIFTGIHMVNIGAAPTVKSLWPLGMLAKNILFEVAILMRQVSYKAVIKIYFYHFDSTKLICQIKIKDYNMIREKSTTTEVK